MRKKNAKKVTSKRAAKSASKVLRDKRTGRHSKAAAGSALSQKPGRRRSCRKGISSRPRPKKK